MARHAKQCRSSFTLHIGSTEHGQGQLSTRIIRDNQAIAVEDLAVKGLARTRLAKSVHDAGWTP